MDDNVRDHRVDEFLENEDIHQIVWPVRYPDLFRMPDTLWGGQLQPPSENHPRPENIGVERVKLISTGTYKFSYFRYKITV
ncbi:hypothetical protein TNCV_5099671 [Trichonephila clavipes]|uniref:Uncharacterized protein n=1 Tax=Trichonephila clavipes TaxID=2585209 RepID=A0A8X6S504_TRICX|nr:hypothetical protein TNCV_5099671 [Trichonephila clavipes]